MSISIYAANKILDRGFGTTAWTPPATFYFGLSTTAPSSDGTNVTEPSGGSYARIGVTNNKTNFAVASAAALDNLTAITFVESSGSWGTITYVVIYDALTSGNLLYYDALSPSKTIQTATTVLFAIGSVTISMTN